MGFFADERPEPEPEPEEEADRPWVSPPEGELPRVLPVAEVLARSTYVAVLLQGIRAYSAGLELTIEARLRRHDADDDRWDDLQSRFGEFERRRRRGGGPLRLGLVLADGRALRVDGKGPTGADGRPEGPVLTGLGGGGMGSARFQTTSRGLWLWPLPPEGALEVVLDWADLDLPETRRRIELGLPDATPPTPIWLDGDARSEPRSRSSWQIRFR